MKKMIKLLSAIFLVGVVMSSCDDDDDETNKGSYLKVDGVEYDLSDGLLVNYGDDEYGYEGFNIDLTLYSNEISIDGEGDFASESGGEVVYFELFSSKETELAEGVYTFSSSSPYPVETFDYGQYATNFSPDAETYDDFGEFEGGTVTVSKDGNEYTIEIDCVNSDGQEITGYYQGTLDYYDVSTYYFDMSASLKSNKAKKYILKK